MHIICSYFPKIQTVSKPAFKNALKLNVTPHLSLSGNQMKFCTVHFFFLSFDFSCCLSDAKARLYLPTILNLITNA